MVLVVLAYCQTSRRLATSKDPAHTRVTVTLKLYHIDATQVTPEMLPKVSRTFNTSSSQKR